jgi:short-subunit dehydrogenase
VNECVQGILKKTGRIDALVNNAGYTLVGALEETSIEEAKGLFETNFFGTMRVSNAVLPTMRQQGSGRIVNIGSMVGFLPAPYQGVYSASKHAIEGYSESLEHEVRQFGIHVSVIEPGFTRTQMDKNAQSAQKRLEAYATERSHVLDAVRLNTEKGKQPASVAGVTLEALTSPTPRARYLVGSDAKMVAGIRKFAPAGLFDWGLRKRFGLTAI